jgi:hypothetical protein
MEAKYSVAYTHSAKPSGTAPKLTSAKPVALSATGFIACEKRPKNLYFRRPSIQDIVFFVVARHHRAYPEGCNQFHCYASPGGLWINA